jgi:four helix bundle protein
VVRAAISVPANIAEGYSRGTLGAYLHSLDIARGSLAEVEYYLLFAEREGLIPGEQAASLHALRDEAGMVLHGLWRSLKNRAGRTDWDHSGLVREEQAPYSISFSDSERMEP